MTLYWIRELPNCERTAFAIELVAISYADSDF